VPSKQIQVLLRVILAMALACPCICFGSSIAWGRASYPGGGLNAAANDPSGASMPNAIIELKELSTNDICRAVMQATGRYAFPNPPRGTYELRINANGFATQVFELVEIKTSPETNVKAALKLGATIESVNVGRFLGFKFAGGRSPA